MPKKPFAAPLPTIQPTSIEIAWAAGLYEGEGTAGFTGSGLCVKMVQKDPWVLYRLQAFFGGTVGQQRGVKPGSVYGNWVLCGANARNFLWLIYSMLSPRRQQQINCAVSRRKGIF